MVMPNFLVIGAAKAGTTSLYHYLNQHPQIYMSPRKETYFFMSSNNEIENYKALFKEANGEIAIGEATPFYLYNKKSPELIKNCLPQVKLIIVLRNPVDRAYSHFLYWRSQGQEPIVDFAKAIREEPIRIRDGYGINYHYINQGFYAPQLQRYLNLFDSSNIKINLYSDLVKNPSHFVKEIYNFLDVDDSFAAPTNQAFKKTAVPRNKVIDKILKTSNPVKEISKTLLSDKSRKLIANKLLLSKLNISYNLRQELIEFYREDILKTQRLVQRDLSIWLQ